MAGARRAALLREAARQDGQHLPGVLIPRVALKHRHDHVGVVVRLVNSCEHGATAATLHLKSLEEAEQFIVIHARCVQKALRAVELLHQLIDAVSRSQTAKETYEVLCVLYDATEEERVTGGLQTQRPCLAKSVACRRRQHTRPGCLHADERPIRRSSRRHYSDERRLAARLHQM